MISLRDVLTRLEQEGAALGHFNVADLVLLKAVLGAVREVGAPALVGASEGERDFFGTRQLATLVKSLRGELELPIFLNADHTHSLAKAMAAAILDRVLERGRFIHLDGPSGRTRHLNLEETLLPKAERLRISGINGSEFPEPTA